MADRRLALVQAEGGARNMTLREERIEHDEQVEVDSGKTIHLENIDRARSEFPFLF
ncbi:hypothetical protein D3C86_1911090 [compost metagenome]